MTQYLIIYDKVRYSLGKRGDHGYPILIKTRYHHASYLMTPGYHVLS